MKYETNSNGSNLKIAIIRSQFNELVVKELYHGAVNSLLSLGVKRENIDEAQVPGAFELPFTALNLVKLNKYDAIVCLGAVIRGETSHYDYVCNEVAKGINQVQMTSGVPCIFGVLTTENLDQALNRAGGKHGNKGADAGVAAVTMANLVKSINQNK